MRALFAVLVLLLTAGGGVCDDSSEQAVARLIENWRWSSYWFGSSGVDDVYVSGKEINALVFWTKKDRRSKTGLCSSELSLCVAYSGPYLDPHAERMQIGPNTPIRDAFDSFVNSGFGGDESYLPSSARLRSADFDSEEKLLTLPTIGEPSSILKRAVPEGASQEAQRMKRLLGCGPIGARSGRSGCAGTLVFAFYGPADPYWFVWRACSTACEFGGDAIEELTRGDSGWEVTSRGFIDRPEAEVERLKQQVRRAEMFRLQL
jgi:hypothetical protein